jgi:hypothetical protein
MLFIHLEKNMSKWDWDWKLEQKFTILCKEFGGEINSNTYTIQAVPLTCTLPGYDDFKAFIQWMDRQKNGFNDKQLMSEYKPPWQENLYHMDGGYLTYLTAKFTLDGIKPKKKLMVFNERDVGIADDMLKQLPSEENVRMEDFFISDEKSKSIVNNIKKPYLRDYASAEIDTDYAVGTTKFVAKSQIVIDINKSSVLSSVLEDADEAVRGMLKETIDAFNKNFEEMKNG